MCTNKENIEGFWCNKENKQNQGDRQSKQPAKEKGKGMKMVTNSQHKRKKNSRLSTCAVLIPKPKTPKENNQDCLLVLSFISH